ncbi:MAG TPA: excalibur calcium-binding domain-containing protein [Frankiaceae bacterium]|nr:excalibur calcium-binding domain-containing protein [Frankiaceae bacterium]
MPQSTRLAVFASYGVPYATHASYELDHLISLELGGDNAADNLWPEPLDGPGGAHVKDGLENRLHSLVCSGRIGLAEAQRAIAGDWAAAAQKYGSDSASSPSKPAVPPISAPSTPPSGIYYANCAAARSAGAAPLRRGQPGYRSGLDGDGDGMACEK